MTGAGLLTGGSGGQFALPGVTISNVTFANNGAGINNGHPYTSVSVMNSHFVNNYSGITTNIGDSDIKNSAFEFNTMYGINAGSGDCMTIGGTTLFFDKQSKFSNCSASYGDNYFRELNGVSGAPSVLQKN